MNITENEESELERQNGGGLQPLAPFTAGAPYHTSVPPSPFILHHVRFDSPTRRLDGTQERRFEFSWKTV
jgi:hypothetical protein